MVDAYEKARWPVHVADPVDTIKAAISFGGHTQEDLAKLLGANRASEVLRGKRHLTLPMIRQFATVWHIPPERLINDYELLAG